MCGRFMLDVEFRDIVERYQINGAGVVYRRAPEIFPTHEVLAIHGEGRELSEMRWGFPNPYGKNRIINARGETVAVKPLFRDSFRQRRCLIPANGFFEWQKRDDGRSVKYRIGLPDRSLFSLAGLYGNFSAGDGNLFPAFTIITTAATAALLPIHDRMPLIIPPADEALWLGGAPADSGAIAALLHPFTGELTVQPES